MPFIGKVLRQVEPFIDKMVITLSKKSNDGTEGEILKMVKEFPTKIDLFYEDVKSLSDLTIERNKQVQHSDSEWILILDDDDYWEKDQLQKCLEELPDNRTLACAVNPYQLLDKETYNNAWKGKWFSKFMRKTPDLHFTYSWPKELPVSNNEILHWKYCQKIKFLPYKFYHLSYLKPGSWRNTELVGKEFKKDNLRPKKLPKPVDFL